MKDPAFLFYYQDFLVGTSFLSNESVGAYIRCLCHQAHKGTISGKDMMKICQSHEIHSDITDKFITDENGEYYNERLRIEIEKRSNYQKSRSDNRRKKTVNPSSDRALTDNNHISNISSSYHQDMEDENENIKEIEKEKESTERKRKGKSDFVLDETDPMTPILKQWLDYKKERKESYKSERGVKAALEELRNLSGNHPETAQAIINQSFAHNWAGIFKLKSYGNSRPTPVQQPKTLEDYATQDYSGRF